MQNNKEIVEKLVDNKENLVFSPTPNHKLNYLTEYLNGPSIYIKREDLTGLAFGGNKSRKLEYLMKDAKNKKADVILTMGAPQSNCCRQSAAAAALYKMECILFLVGPEAGQSGNVLLDNLFGAQLIYMKDDRSAREALHEKIAELEKIGKRPYFVPPGGTSPWGNIGYISACKEILEDERRMNVKFDYIVFASATLGTQVGLLIGNHLYSDNQKTIYAIPSCKSFLDTTSGKTMHDKIVDELVDFDEAHGTNLANTLPKEKIILDHNYNGTGYSVVSDQDIFGMEIFRKTEAILLDPVYSGRAGGGLVDIIKKGIIPKEKNVLFIHTGGSPSIFTDLMKKK